jgi:hypothetical protein
MKATHDSVREVLATVGPLTSREVAAFFPGVPHRHVAAILSTLRSAARKQVYVYGWTRDNGHGRTYLRAVHALGDLPDARKPAPLTNAQRCQRWKDKRAVPKVANSVWTWGAQL